MIEETPKDPSKMVGSVKLPIAAVNKSSLYKRCNGESDTSEKVQRTFKDKVSETASFDNLSPNVKRMISSATETTTLKFQRKGNNARTSTRQRSNIPLFGATSKLTQSGVDILDSVEIYDQPCGIKSFGKKVEEESPSKLPLKPDFRIDEQTTYDVPTNNRPAIYDVPVANKTAFESLSLPYIDQSIELSISSNDREFDIKLSSKDNSPQKPVKTEVPSDTFPNGTNSLNRKDFVSKIESPSKLAKSGPYPEVVGSTGNLKTIPTKETLHPPPIEVTRPLSMSSIASSSSTSSSGVQNKGGVNSAYLASIESLDDHSDADIASANGSNNFVNSAGILNKGATEERHTETIPRQSWNEVSGLSQLERVCAEIVQTENVYVEDLRQVVEGYLHEWRRFTTFSEDELTELFNNIEDIYNFNRSLCEELNTCRLDATCIARCFVNNTSGFSVYTSYCTGYPRTMARLAALAGGSLSAREFRERQLALGHPLPLASYLLKPVQRILKYHLLLQNVVKQCATRETEFALMQMTGIAQHIDDMKRRHEHAVRVQEIQSLLYGWTGPDLTTYGELCAEGTFRVFGAKAMRHAFLFDKMLLVTKNREDGILAYKSHIMCNNMMLVESIAGAPLSFHVIPWDAPRAQLTLQARSPRHKREWTLLLKRVSSHSLDKLTFHVIPWDAPRAQLTLQARSPRHKREWTLLLKRVSSHSLDKLTFHVIPWDAPRAQLTLQARSPRHKREWTLLLKRVSSHSLDKLTFHVIPWDAPRAQLTLQARSPRHKREWTLLLKRVSSHSLDKLTFHVIPWDAPRAQLTLQARSPRHKREWTLLLKRVSSHSLDKLTFHVIPWDAPRAQLTLQARSPRHKREWTLLLKRVSSHSLDKLRFHVIPWDAPRAQLTLQARSPRHKREWTLLLKRVSSHSLDKLTFHVIPWDAPRAQLTLQARSPRHKREWTLLLKRVILENYNAVIPSHARQLVMELGQNKTDDDILAEKSHNLITQASMRKQLSAPEYLEKRKLERERRKSFENGARGRMKKNMKYSVPNNRTSNQDCDCAQVSLEKGTDYTCDTCYIDLCSDCEAEISKKDKDCSCSHDDGKEKCPECDRALQFIDSGSAEHLERKQSVCKCSDFKSSQESFAKEYNGSLNKIRGYHSSDNIVGYTDAKSKDDLSDTNNSLVNVRNIPKSCLKCAKIKENIVTDSTSTIHSRKSRCNDNDKHKTDTLRSKSKEDPQRSKLSKIGTWRRKSEPGLQQNTAIMIKKNMDSDTDRNEGKGTEKIEFECRNCGSNKITRKAKNTEGVIISDPEVDARKSSNTSLKPTIEIKMYNTKKVPKKISKLKKNRANGLRLGTDTTAKFYADFSTDVSTENILHISESTDSLNVDKSKDSTPSSVVPETISKDEDIDEETYKKLIEKTDSFKKNELEKVKYLNKQKVINEGSETEEKIETREDAPSGEDVEQPLEQIISQLLMQNREFQKLLKKQQLRNSAQRRHQRLLKSHSNPEHPVNKPKYCRQASETLLVSKDEPDVQVLSPPNEINDASDDDHIYETLRVENRVEDGLHSLNSKSKSIQHTSHVPRPKRIPSPPNAAPTKVVKNVDSDYVYLSFDKLNKLQDSEGIYDVPVKSPEKVNPQTEECYETMEHRGSAIDNNTENLYDSLMEICRRKKDTPNTLPGDYLPMSPEQQSPNTPEIWLSRQKEHFNVSRDRKSGSLPRSFQVITNNQEENTLSSFKCKPNSNSKTYLNRDGKVMSTDRPFTIASDKSEISYDDVENYMSEGDILKFNKTTNSNDSDYVQNISQSTLELEQEIDKCYKNNFEKDLDANKNQNLLTVSQPNLNTSTTSSCEVLPLESNDDKKEIDIIHPEHKIYKPTSNMLSLKNVLSRFKNRSPPKNTEEEINANDQSSPEIKTDAKSPTSEKRPGLNPRSYSKNLLQRFRSIIGDEHSDDNQNRTETKKNTDDINNSVKTDIKVVITSTDVSPTTSTVVYSFNNDPMSKSVYEQTTLTESQNEKNNLETLSHSCDSIPQKPEVIRPNYEKSVSMVTNISNASSPSKSTSNSYQSLNKLPIYMQGSKHLGARIAQREYADPVTLVKEKSALKNVNVLINKNAVRPDSLFSNSSFVTTSSESADHEVKQEAKKDNSNDKSTNSDESFYEKSFEKIEHVVDEDVYRDSAVYSDQEEVEESKTESSDAKSVSKTVSRIESIKHSSSFRAQRVTVTSSVCNTKATVAKKIPDSNAKTKIEQKGFDKDKPKAPPVPVKPKITNIPTPMMVKNVVTNKNNLAKNQDQSSSSESVNIKTIRRNTSYIHKIKNENIEPTEGKVEKKVNEEGKEETDGSGIPKPTGNIQIKRLSFERASLDSATRKIRTNETKRTSVEPQKTSKSVLERRMEIEMMSKSLTKQSQIAKKPAAKPKPISTKVASFERSVSEVRGSTKGTSFERSVSEAKNEVLVEATVSNEENREESKTEVSDDAKSSWVKQVVNKFQ
ncbi:uncharacterized protein LOC133531004 isoform X2 [Cydia pomonella]|nr:uncharacterized protein LOC133531004 isoform X2 [Cydia pomonella]